MSTQSVNLAFEEYGSGPPIVILHGLFGSFTNLKSIAKRLSADFRAISLDLRNHGRSGWHDDMSYLSMAADVRDFIRQQDLGPVTVLGHSMGGKTAMVLALTNGELVKKLIVVDIAPVVYHHSLDSFAESMLALNLDQLLNRKQADTELAQSISDAPTRQFLLQNLIINNGKFSWRIHLDSIQRNMETLTGFPLELNGSQFNGATLFIHGGDSGYLRPEHLPRIRQLFPKNRIVTIEKAGHWLHVQSPDELLDHIITFINKDNF